MPKPDRAEWQLDGRRLQKSGIGDKIVLIISCEVGWCIGVLGGAPFAKSFVVDGAGLMGVVEFGQSLALSLIVGGIAVPIFGLVMGFAGLSNARERIIRGTKTSLLADDHDLTRAVHGLARALELKTMPRIGIYPDDDINAFAAGSGPKKAVVSFSQGLIDRCTNRELLAIAAHELAHIANNDMRRMQYAWSFQNALTWYMMFERARACVRWMLSTIGELLILRLSRKREYWADATAAALVGKEPMIEALLRLKGDPVEPSASKLAYARLMIRSNPREWLSTHPPLASRIEALISGKFTNRLPFRSE